MDVEGKDMQEAAGVVEEGFDRTGILRKWLRMVEEEEGMDLEVLEVM